MAARAQLLVSAGKLTVGAVKGVFSSGKAILEALQWIASTGTSVGEATQLSYDLSSLRESLPEASILIHRGDWGRFRDNNLAKLLSQLRDKVYDAEDLLRELDDEVLRHKVEDADRSRPGQLWSSSVNLVNSFLRRTKARVKGTHDRLKEAQDKVQRVLDSMGLPVEPVRQLMPETSSVISAPEVFGRDTERDELMQMLGVMLERGNEVDQVITQMGVPPLNTSTAGSEVKGTTVTSRANKRLKGSSSNSSINHTDENNPTATGGISVLPIYGIGGMGKTTLAQFIYNDPRVQAHFSITRWVCVSDLFDKKRITVEIIKSLPAPRKEFNNNAPKKEFNTSCSLDALQDELKERLKDQHFLLVLDDIWPKANEEWETFSAPLRQGREGSMILVTTRYPGVAKRVATSNCKPVELQGLPTNIFWDFFKRCAFGRELPENYHELEDIGQSICRRLRGSPLAAKTLGRLLNMNLTKQHWETIQNSELWQLPHEDNEILPALRLSYLYLPQQLKRCFAFCSMFPKDYSFKRLEIVGIWVAQGFVEQVGNMRPEDEGDRYLDELRRRFLFQHDPKFPNEDTRYVMHDLIHDMAQSVSVDECFLMQDLSYHNQRIPKHVRHMSIEVDDECLGRATDIQHLNKLHSLRFGTRFRSEISCFNQLSNILYLSLNFCKLGKLPESICELTSLRYLDISHSRVHELPEKLFSLYSLQVLDASCYILKIIHEDITKLINLRYVVLSREAALSLSKVSGLGNMSCLRNLSDFTVGRQNGRGIGELKLMNQLSGKLHIRSLQNVRCKEEAAEARLGDKQYLKELMLEWSGSNYGNAIEGLLPHSRIERLVLYGFWGEGLPSWFKPQNLSSLRSLEVSSCNFFGNLSFADRTQAGLLTGDDWTTQQHGSSSISCSNGIASSAFRRLIKLRLCYCDGLTNLDQFLSPEYLPSVKSILIERCVDLVSIPVHTFVGFACLQDLKLIGCSKLVCPREMTLPSSLRRLCVGDCNELDRSFPACIENLTSLTLLQLYNCHNVKSIPLNLISTNMLKCLVLHHCYELSSIGGSRALSSIQHVEISFCRLTEVNQPFGKNGLQPREDKELLKFLWVQGQ